jgi:hypothetical protein
MGAQATKIRTLADEVREYLEAGICGMDACACAEKS